MALFKHFRGSRANLDAQPLHDGYAYFCTDDGTFHIDYLDGEGNLKRKQISAKDAETLGLHTADEFLLKSEFSLSNSETDSTAIQQSSSAALSSYTSALGEETIAGGRGFKFIQETSFDLANGVLTLHALDANREESEEVAERLTADLTTLADILNGWHITHPTKHLGASLTLDIGYTDMGKSYGMSYLFYNSIQVTNIDPASRTISFELKDGYESKLLTDSAITFSATTTETDDDGNEIDVPAQGTLTFNDYPDLGSHIIGDGAATRGIGTKALGYCSSAEGFETRAVGNDAHAEGYNTFAITYGHAEGTSTKAYGRTSHSEGKNTSAYGFAGHAEGEGTKSYGSFTHTEGTGTIGGDPGNNGFLYNYSINNPIAAHAEGIKTVALAKGSHTEGKDTRTGLRAYQMASVNGTWIHLNTMDGIATGKDYRVTICTNNMYYECGKIRRRTADDLSTVIRVQFTADDGFNSTEILTLNSDPGSHNYMLLTEYPTQGDFIVGEGSYSHAEGIGTQALSEAQHVEGSYNIPDTKGNYVHIVGNGNSDADRSNAYTLDWNGNATFAGDVYARYNEPLAKKSDIPDVSKFITEIPEEYVTESELEAKGYLTGGSFDDYLKKTDTVALNGALSTNPDYANAIKQDGCEVRSDNSIALGEGTAIKSKGFRIKTLSVPDDVKNKITPSSTTNIKQLQVGDQIYLKANKEVILTVSQVGSSSIFMTPAIEGLALDDTTDNYFVVIGKPDVGNAFFSCPAAITEGIGTVASSTAQHVAGRYNIPDNANQYAHIIGNGSDNDNRSNAATIDWNGNAWFAGDVIVGNKGRLISENDIGDGLSITEDGKLVATGSGSSGGDKLYRHYITLSGACMNEENISFVIYNNDPTNYSVPLIMNEESEMPEAADISALLPALKAHGPCLASGVMDESGSGMCETYVRVNRVYAHKTWEEIMCITEHYNEDGQLYEDENYTHPEEITDIVTEITL